MKNKHFTLTSPRSGKWVTCNAKNKCYTGGRHITNIQLLETQKWLQKYNKKKPLIKITKTDVNRYFAYLKAEEEKTKIFGLKIKKTVQLDNIILDAAFYKKVKTQARKMKIKLELTNVNEIVGQKVSLVDIETLTATGTPTNVYGFEDWLLEAKDDLLKVNMNNYLMSETTYEYMVDSAIANNITIILGDKKVYKKFILFGKRMFDFDNIQLFGSSKEVKMLRSNVLTKISLFD